MRRLSLFLLCTTAFTTSNTIRQLHPKFKCTKEYHDICLPDLSGYNRCMWRNRSYQPILYKKCSGVKPLCKCYETPDMSICQCVNTTTPPPFPSRGKIRWIGTQKITTYYGVNTYNLHGEVRKDNNGHYIHQWTEGKGGPLNFEIIIPSVDGKGFIKVCFFI